MSGGMPSGTVAFLFTDVVGSTRLWEEHDEQMDTALALHDEILRSAIEREEGYVFSTAGDAFAAAFASAGAARNAALSVQDQLSGREWPTPEPVRVRIGLHVGEAHEREGDYFGPTVNRAARIMSAAHGGQIIASAAFAALVGTEAFLDLGAHRLKDLGSAEHLWQVNSGSFPALRTLDAVRHNLPVVSEELVGRVDDLERIGQLARSNTLVSVLGPGGMGKTRVALEVAAELVSEFPDGVWFVDLAPVEVDAVGRAVMDTLGTTEKPGLTLDEALVEFCRSRRLLMVLDNCEHVIDPVARLVSMILGAAPGVRVLATTREAVGIHPEALYPLRPLSGGADGDAATLFLERAGLVDPVREWTSSDVELVVGICERLDGMPLAIELAASRLRSMSVADLSERLEGSLRSLRGPKRGNERHRTIDATIRWSYHALHDDERRLFEHMAVFRGGARLEAIQQVMGSADPDEIEEVLDELVGKSMVQADTEGLTTRYRLLEPLRQFAEDALRGHGELDPALDRHGDHFAAWAEDWRDDVWGPGRDLRSRLDAEWANVRFAVDWAIDCGSVDVASRLIRAMETAQWLWNRLEVGEWAERALALPGADDRLDGPELAGTLGERLWSLEEVAAFEATVDRAWAMPHADPSKIWPAVHEACRAGNIRGDRVEGAEILDRIEADDHRETAWLLWFHLSVGRTGQELVDAFDRLAAESSSAVVSTMAAIVRSADLATHGDALAAIEQGRIALGLAQALDSHFLTAMTAISLGCVLGVTGSTSPDDLEMLRLTLAEQERLGLRIDEWLILIGIAVATDHLHDEPLAADVQRSLIAKSPWNDPDFLAIIPTCLPNVAAQLEEPGDILDRATLVDRALEVLDDLIAWPRASASPAPSNLNDRVRGVAHPKHQHRGDS